MQGFILSGILNFQGQRLHNLSGHPASLPSGKIQHHVWTPFFFKPKSVIFCPSTTNQCKEPAPFSWQGSIRLLLPPCKASSQPFQQEQFPPHSRVYLYTEYSCPGGMLSKTIGRNNHLPWSTGYTPIDTAQDDVDQLGCQGMLLTQVQHAGYQDPKSLPP